MQSGGADPRDAEEAAAKEGTIAGTGIAVLQAAPAPPPETMECPRRRRGATARGETTGSRLKEFYNVTEVGPKSGNAPSRGSLPNIPR